jgi:uncharacterized protein (TIGR03084 family)
MSLVDDLAAEQDSLDALVAELDETTWARPTPSDGWNVRDQIAHLAFFDDTAVASLTGDRAGPMAELRTDMKKRRREIDHAHPGQDMTGSDVLAWWRTARSAELDAFRTIDPAERVPWGPNLMAARSLCTARLMEAYAHGLDCYGALGVEPVDTDRLRHVCHIIYRAIPHAFRDSQIEMPDPLDQLVVEVTGPSGDLWRFGTEDAPQRIVGSASEFARVGVRRMVLADAATLRASGRLASAALPTLKAYL